MTTTVGTPDSATAPYGATFESLKPANGDVVGMHSVSSNADVDAAVQRARDAAEWWGGLSFDERANYLLKGRSLITRRLVALSEFGASETGKPTADALLEIAMAIDHVAWAAKHAKKVLCSRKVKSDLVMSTRRRPSSISRSV